MNNMKQFVKELKMLVVFSLFFALAVATGAFVETEVHKILSIHHHITK